MTRPRLPAYRMAGHLGLSADTEHHTVALTPFIFHNKTPWPDNLLHAPHPGVSRGFPIYFDVIAVRPAGKRITCDLFCRETPKTNTRVFRLLGKSQGDHGGKWGGTARLKFIKRWEFIPCRQAPFYSLWLPVGVQWHLSVTTTHRLLWWSLWKAGGSECTLIQGQFWKE